MTVEPMTLEERSWLHSAYETAALFSDDKRTRVGAVLIDSNGSVIVNGANAFPKGIKVTPERLAEKHNFILHAEEQLLLSAAYFGKATDGTLLVCNWAACTRCARQIIEAGVAEVVTHQDFEDVYRKQSPSSRWLRDCELAYEMFREAGVSLRKVSGKIGGGLTAVTYGFRWAP